MSHMMLKKEPELGMQLLHKLGIIV